MHLVFQRLSDILYSFPGKQVGSSLVDLGGLSLNDKKDKSSSGAGEAPNDDKSKFKTHDMGIATFNTTPQQQAGGLMMGSGSLGSGMGMAPRGQQPPMQQQQPPMMYMQQPPFQQQQPMYQQPMASQQMPQQQMQPQFYQQPMQNQQMQQMQYQQQPPNHVC